MNNSFLTKMIFFTVETYLFKSDIRNELQVKLLAGINSFKKMRLFTREESEMAMEFGEDEYLHKITNVEVDYGIYAMELMRLWTLRMSQKYQKGIYLGVPKSKLKVGSATYAVEMAKLKYVDKEEYDKYKAIILDSVNSAKAYYDFLEEKIKKRLT